MRYLEPRLELGSAGTGTQSPAVRHEVRLSVPQERHSLLHPRLCAERFAKAALAVAVAAADFWKAAAVATATGAAAALVWLGRPFYRAPLALESACAARRPPRAARARAEAASASHSRWPCALVRPPCRSLGPAWPRRHRAFAPDSPLFGLAPRLLLRLTHSRRSFLALAHRPHRRSCLPPSRPPRCPRRRGPVLRAESPDAVAAMSRSWTPDSPPRSAPPRRSILDWRLPLRSCRVARHALAQCPFCGAWRRAGLGLGSEARRVRGPCA